MFTGIIEARAKILSKTDTQLVIERPQMFDDLKLGSSIAVSGVCLTIVSMNEKHMIFDVVAETWAKTKLGDLHTGDTVNLERALRADGRLDGHIVQGHTEGVAVVKSLQKDVLTLTVPALLLPFVIPKGSITLDGVALTVVTISDSTLTAALIPETLHRTTLGELKPGDRVNIETDVLGRYVYAMISHSR